MPPNEVNPANNLINRFSGPSEATCALVSTTQTAKFKLDILSDHLALYHNDDLTAAISRFVRRHRSLRARILIKDSRPLRGLSHTLVTLAQKLPSKVQLRVLTDDALPQKISYCLADETFTYFDLEADNTGFSGIDRARVKQYRENFEQLWQNQSLIDPDLSLLSI